MICLIISRKKNNNTGSVPPIIPPVITPVDTLNGWTKTQINRGPTSDVIFQDQLHGLLIYDKTIASTTDGGLTWSDLPTAVDHYAFIADNTGPSAVN